MPLRITMKVPRSGVDTALEGLVQQNLELMRRADDNGAPLPRIYTAGVRYQREPEGEDHWAKATEVLMVGWGDCEDLAGWLAAELRHTGEDPGARAIAIPTSRPEELHAVVELSDGTIVDVSRDLEPKSKQQLAEEQRMQIRFEVKRLPGGGWAGMILLPLATEFSPAMGALDPSTARERSRDLRRNSAVVAQGKTAAEAFGLAAEIASAAAENPLLLALLPPGAGLALQAAKEIGAGLDSGDIAKVEQVLSEYTGPGMRRIASALSRLF